jgi:hypothetical protein
MSLKLQGALGAALALLATTPCFAFSIVSAPVINDYSAVAKHFGAAGARYFQDASAGQSPSVRAASHGAMVTYDLSASAVTSQPPLSRDAIADHSADPRFNPFAQDADTADSPAAPSTRVNSGGPARAR